MARPPTLVKVVVKTWDGSVARPGEVTVQSWLRPKRTKRAAKTLAIGWGLAIVSIFLPGAHFFLVPAFFLGSPVVAYLVSRQKSIVLGGESTCPSCNQKLTIVKGPEDWPLEDICVHCRNHVRIEPAN